MNKKIFVLLIFILSSFTVSSKEIIFEDNNKVFNMTKIAYLDTFIHVGLIEIGIDSVVVIIKPIVDPYYLDDGDTEAYIEGYGKQYIIWINEKTKLNINRVLSHELIHLRQYYHFELIISGLLVMWMGEYFDVDGIDYEDRPWENEAYSEENELYTKISKQIKKLRE